MTIEELAGPLFPMTRQEIARQCIGTNSITAAEAKAILELLGYLPTSIHEGIIGGWRFACGATVEKFGGSKVIVKCGGICFSSYIADIVALDYQKQILFQSTPDNDIADTRAGTVLDIAKSYFDTFILEFKNDYPRLIINGSIHARPL